MTIDISDNDPRISYSVAESVLQTSFVVPFEFFEDEDLNVYVDEVQKTLTTHYTTTGGSGEVGTIVMNVTGATGGSTVVITRSIALERLTDFPNSGPFNIAQLNTELDRFIAISADQQDRFDRTVGLNDFDADASLVIPTLASRKGKLLGFNITTGALEAGPDFTDATTLAGISADIEILADIEDGTDATDAIQTVAGIAADVSLVAAVDAEVALVAAVDGEVASLSAYTTEIAALYANLAGLLATEALTNLVNDTTPQLGGDLDPNSFDITAPFGVGVNDSVRGQINLYGAATTNGGEIVLYASADNDTTNQAYTIGFTGEDFAIADDGGDLMIYDQSISRWRFVANDFAFGSNDTTPGDVKIFGGGATEAGGTLTLFAAADHDTTNDFYKFTFVDDALVLQLEDATNIFEIDENKTQIQGMHPLVTRITSPLDTPTDHTLQSWTKSLRVRMAGGGGAGGGADSDTDGGSGDGGAGGGGTSGSYHEFWIDVVAAGITKFTYTIGSGGAGSAGAAGADGQDTTYADTALTTMVATGGPGGDVRLDAATVNYADDGGGSAGSQTIGTGYQELIELRGMKGFRGMVFPAGGVSAGKFAQGGTGGSNMFGGPGIGAVAGADGQTNAGSNGYDNTGAGGGGAASIGQGAAAAGGDGADGIIIVEEFPF